MNPLRRLLLGSGRLSEELRTELAAQRLVLLDEGLSGSITYRHYRSPQRRSNWRKEAISGAIAVTRGRLVVWANRGKHVDVPLAHPAVEAEVERPDRLLIAYDAAAFDASRSGRVEVRMRTAQAARIVELIARAD